MPNEIIILQIGQCGNQVGEAFWKIVLEEHASANRRGVYDSALSTLFRHSHPSACNSILSQTHDPEPPLKGLKARALLFDLEQNVVDAMFKRDMGELFDTNLKLTQNSGAGNNWAVGCRVNGPKLHTKMMKKIMKAVEDCSSLQAFVIILSTGGGTGSGLGSYVLETLAHEFPKIDRIVIAIYPSQNSPDVIVSPYNTCLATWKLKEHASIVLPISNHSKFFNSVKQSHSRQKQNMPYIQINEHIGSLLSSVTCTTRFHTGLKINCNELATNLIPFPALHYCIPAMGKNMNEDKFTKNATSYDNLLQEISLPAFQMSGCQPRRGMCVSLLLLFRGQQSIGNYPNITKKIKKQLKMPLFAHDALKIGSCDVALSNQNPSILGLFNSCDVVQLFEQEFNNFRKMFRKKAHLHHFTNCMDINDFYCADESIRTLMADYRFVNQNALLIPHQMSDVVNNRLNWDQWFDTFTSTLHKSNQV